MKIYDANGKERDREWVVSKYNLPEIDRALKELDHWEVVELREIIGPMAITITTLDIKGKPVGGIDVWVSWPDGKGQLRTKAEGYVDFIMGGDAAYKPWEGEVGSYSVSIWSSEEYSEIIEGLGWRGKTNHAHLNPTFRFMRAKEPEEPPAEECKDCPRYRKALSEIHAIVAEALGG